MENHKISPVVIVIGGGPAGLMAAGTAASMGARVLLFEKNADCGKKLLLTGSGKCNLTNRAPLETFLEQYAENRKFLYPSFREFFHDELERFFNRHQVFFQTEENGKIFPTSKSAGSVLTALLSYCSENKVEFHLEEPVMAIEPVKISESMKFSDLPAESAERSGTVPISTWRVLTTKGNYTAESIILATGGLSYPKTGSSGDGFRMAKELSHTVVPTRPALVPLATNDPWSAVLSGVSVRDAGVSLHMQSLPSPARKIAAQRGDVLFTHFGLSGPPILFLSRWLPDHFETLKPKNSYFVSVDLFPDLSVHETEAVLLRHFLATPSRLLKTILHQAFGLPLALAAALVLHLDFGEEITGQEMTREKRVLLLSSLKSLKFPLSKTRGYSEAMVTAGGISTKEIRPQTMESNLVSHLFFAGELIDIDGYTGGFNLQAAFSTGYLAGRNAVLQRTAGTRDCPQ